MKLEEGVGENFFRPYEVMYGVVRTFYGHLHLSNCKRDRKLCCSVSEELSAHVLCICVQGIFDKSKTNICVIFLPLSKTCLGELGDKEAGTILPFRRSPRNLGWS